MITGIFFKCSLQPFIYLFNVINVLVNTLMHYGKYQFFAVLHYNHYEKEGKCKQRKANHKEGLNVEPNQC